MMSATATHWERNLDDFRLSPSKFLTERNISGDSFVLDILKVLCSENLPENLKLQLLFLLQEKASSLLVESTSVECVVGSLKEMFTHSAGQMPQRHSSETSVLPGPQRRSSSAESSNSLRKDMFSSSPGSVSQLYLSQVLVTGTVVLITSDLLEINQNIFVDFSGIMTDVVGMVNNPNNLLVRKTACECLLELELSYPGLLQAKLDHLYAFCATERSPIFQTYMLLFVTVLHHAMEHLLQDAKDGLDGSCINSLLTSRTEPLKPLYVTGQGSKELYPVAIHAQGSTSPKSPILPQDVDTRELKRAISFVMDNIGFINTTSLFHVIMQLMQCVELAGLSPNTFKSQFIIWVSTTDLSVFHMLLLLKLKFSSEMFLEGDELLLLQRVLLVSSQPTLPHGQRLLCYDWLMYFPTDLEYVMLQPCIPPFLDYAQLNFFYPSVFDPLDILQCKLKALSLCLDHETLEMPGFPGGHLTTCLLPLLKRIQHGDHRRKVVVTLFRIILWYYRYHWNTELGNEIYRLVLSIVTEHPNLTPHTEDFLDCVTAVTSNSKFSTDLLRSLCKHVVSQPLETILRNLSHHLKVLSLAMRQRDVTPIPVIRFLIQVLERSATARTGNWNLGNCLLAVCHSILLHHHSADTFSELGDLLLYICASFQDIDIRDRARFYYCLLTNVSRKKCSKILTMDTARQGLPHFTADDITSSSFPVPPPVKHISTPFLKLTRIPQPRPEGSLTDMRLPEMCELENDMRTKGILERYMKTLEGLQDNKEIPVKYYVHFTNDPSTPIPGMIYALVLKFYSENRYKTLEDVRISYLSAKSSNSPCEGCSQITVNFCPLDPVPATFRVRAIFNDESGLTCAMLLDSLPFLFSDLFLPVHIPSVPTATPSPVVKARLFTALWDHITEHQRSTAHRTATGAESVTCLFVEWSIMGRVIQDWLLPFVMRASDDEVQLGIFLPPRHHLLLKFRPLDKVTVISMATDDWRLLRFVEPYLRQLEQVSG